MIFTAHPSCQIICTGIISNTRRFVHAWGKQKYASGIVKNNSGDNWEFRKLLAP
jgi:hypothetical protein